MDKRQGSTEKENIRTGTSPETLAQALLDNLYYVQGRTSDLATPNDWYMALSYTVRDRLLERWIKTILNLRSHARAVCYFSAEFLMGPQLSNNLIQLGIF